MKVRKSAVRMLRRLFDANPPGIALWLVAGQLLVRLKSLILESWLKAPGIYVGAGCRILGGRYIRFGRGIRAQRGLWLEAVTDYRSQSFRPEIILGDGVCFSDSVHISAIERIVIGNHVLMGSGIYISDHNHGIYKGSEQSDPRVAPADRALGGGGPVAIGCNVWIGDHVVILGPAVIGEGAIIGANSVVRGNVEPNCIVAGAPARVIKRFNVSTLIWESK